MGFLQDGPSTKRTWRFLLVVKEGRFGDGSNRLESRTGWIAEFVTWGNETPLGVERKIFNL